MVLCFEALLASHQHKQVGRHTPRSSSPLAVAQEHCKAGDVQRPREISPSWARDNAPIKSWRAPVREAPECLQLTLQATAAREGACVAREE